MARELECKRYDINVYIGSDVNKFMGRRNLDRSAVDLSGSTIVSQIRAGWGEDTALIQAFTVDTSDLANGNFYLQLTRTQTIALRTTLTNTYSATLLDDGLYSVQGYYDVVIKDTGGLSKPWVRGVVYFFETNSTPA